MKKALFLFCTLLYATSAHPLDIRVEPNKIINHYKQGDTYYMYVDLFTGAIKVCHLWVEVDVWLFGPPTIRPVTLCL